MDKKIDEKSKQMHEKIKDIQNTIWIIFREFEETHDMENIINVQQNLYISTEKMNCAYFVKIYCLHGHR